MEAYTPTLGLLTYLLTHWSVHIMFLYLIWSLSPGSKLVYMQIEAVGNELVGLNADNLVVGNPGASPAHLSGQKNKIET